MQVTDPAGTAEFRKEGPRSTVATVGIVVPLFGMENLQDLPCAAAPAGGSRDSGQRWIATWNRVFAGLRASCCPVLLLIRSLGHRPRCPVPSPRKAVARSTGSTVVFRTVSKAHLD